MPKKVDQRQVQIDWIVNRLKEGKERADILQEFTKRYNLKTKTFDNRLKIARERFEQYREETKEENDKKLREDPEWSKTHANLLKSKKLIYDSISYIIQRRQKKVNIGGKERIVLDVDISEARNLKTLWEMNLVGLGEPTTVSQNKTDITTKGESINKIELTIE